MKKTKFKSRIRIEKAMKALDSGDNQLAAALLKTELRSSIEPLALKAYGVALARQNELHAALIIFRRLVNIAPEDAEAIYNLGVLHENMGDLSEALVCYSKSLTIKPEYRDALNNYALIQERLGKVAEAKKIFSVMSSAPGDYRAVYNLARLNCAMGEYESAQALAAQLTSLDSSTADHWNLKGNVERGLGNMSEAVQSFENCLRLEPEHHDAWGNLGVTYKDAGLFEKAQDCFLKAIDVQPNESRYLSQMLFSLTASGAEPKTVRDWAVRYGTSMPAGNNPTSSVKLVSSPLRVGFVSGDLRRHPVATFLIQWIHLLDPSRLAIYFFSNNPFDDEVTKVIRSASIEWISVKGVSAEGAAKLVTEHKVDVLIDLAGHTAYGRLDIFSLKPAPIQISWLGYFGTTGLAQMDYFLGDPVVLPDKEAGHFTESLARLPKAYLCFAPPAEDIPIVKKKKERGYEIIFGSLNARFKINSDVITVWSKILSGVRNSKLLLKAKAFNDEKVRFRLMEEFASQGITDEQLIFRGSSNFTLHLETYNTIDICLDPFPYPGGTTSFESLWMGVPLVTLAGSNFLSHIGETILSNLELDELVAEDLDEYVSIAQKLASDLGQLSNYHLKLRAHLLNSTLCDGEQFARDFETAIYSLIQA